MTNYLSCNVRLCQINGRQCFRQCADLIYLDQDGIGHVFGNSFAEKFDVRNKKIVTDDVNFAASFSVSFFSRSSRFRRSRPQLK